jgi:hypothetical protein
LSDTPNSSIHPARGDGSVRCVVATGAEHYPPSSAPCGTNDAMPVLDAVFGY